MTNASNGVSAGSARLSCLGQQLRQPIGVGKEHVALVGEVAGERAPSQSGALGDLGNGDVLVPELEGRARSLRSAVVPLLVRPTGAYAQATAMSH